jgi:dUTP pyrophosphatase
MSDNNKPKNYSRTYRSVHNNDSNNDVDKIENNSNNSNKNTNNSKSYNRNSNVNKIFNNYSYVKVYVEKNTNCQIPVKATAASAGFDLFANENIVIKAKSFQAVNTGLKIAIPRGYEMQIRPRSGLALNHGITVLNTPGTIDSDYRGEIKIILYNISDKDFSIESGDRIAQGVFAAVLNIKFELVDEVHSTQRSNKGFGSSGIKGESKYNNNDNNNNDNNNDDNEPLSECNL